MLLLFRHPPCFLAGCRGVAVGTEAIGPEWVYGVVTFLGLDEKKRAVLCRNKAAVGGGGVFWAPPFLSSAVRLFISAESILHHSKQLFLYEHLPLSVFFTRELDRLLGDSLFATELWLFHPSHPQLTAFSSWMPEFQRLASLKAATKRSLVFWH